jgi:hypothetical protein
MGFLRHTLGAVHSDPDEVEARCLLAFCLAIGHHFLAADHGGRVPEAVLDRAGDLIFGRSVPDA